MTPRGVELAINANDQYRDNSPDGAKSYDAPRRAIVSFVGRQLKVYKEYTALGEPQSDYVQDGARKPGLRLDLASTFGIMLTCY